MNSYTLEQAAAFLKMHPEEVRRRAKIGVLPGAKVGRRWVFLDLDLADYIRSLYSQSRSALRVTLGKEIYECPSSNAGRSGQSTSLPPVESEYAELLALHKKPLRRNTTTS